LVTTPDHFLPEKSFMKKSVAGFVSAFAAFAFGSVLRAAPVSMPEVVREYEADARSVDGFYDLPWAEPVLDRQQKMYDGWYARLKTIDFATLPHEGQIDYLLLRNDLDREVDSLARQRQRISEIDMLIPFRKTIADLELARWRDEKIDPAKAAAGVEEIGKLAKELKDRVEKPKAEDKKDEAKKTGEKDAKKKPEKDEKKKIQVEPIRALRAAKAVDGLRNGLKRWFEFHNGYQPEFSWWVKSSYEVAATNLEEYAKFLREEIAGQKGKDDDPLLGEPIGADALADQLKLEFIAYNADEVIAIGERELAWCETEMKKAAKEMGFTNDWKAAMAKVKMDFVPPGEQDVLVGRIAHDAIAFVKEKDFVTVPPLCEETWRMRMMPPDVLKTIPYAAYSPPEMQVAYPRDDMKQEDKLMVMRGNNRHYTRLTVPHELIPGHHLQGFVAARNHEYRRMFGTPFYIEGWALYCEIRLWELGWPQTPEDKIGMLFWHMHRAARIITTVKFQTGRMKPDEMVSFLMDRVGHEKFGATSEVRRFIADETPALYQAGYLLGGRQLHVLHDELTGPGKMTERQFNDAVLEQNSMPVEILRAAIRELPLKPDAQPEWKFDQK
jgi:uncharacterized protein (DUF885 family)